MSRRVIAVVADDEVRRRRLAREARPWRRILDPHDGLGVGILSLADTDTSLDVFAEA